MKVYMYLRKSRADEEEGITLDKHRELLLKFAAENKLTIMRIYEEIVSGESIIHRPEMIKLLKELELNPVDGVLCIDVDRLGRGNMQDQGLILETFKNTKTKIITLRKIYDLENEFDEEYSEFEAFMARKELKMINRRLQRGRVLSVQKGNYISTNPPYGYDIEYTNNKRSLVINNEQANAVKLIFDLYINKGMGSTKIARYLNEHGIKPQRAEKWEASAVRFVLKNMVYIGKITWKKKNIKKSNIPGRKKVKSNPPDEWIISDGNHEPIINEETFKKAQNIMNNKHHIPCSLVSKPRNPLAGLVYCSYCNRKMQVRPYRKMDDQLMCTNRGCNKSSKVSIIEKRILQMLKDEIDKNKLNVLPEDIPSDDFLIHSNNIIKACENELLKLNKQKNILHDLLEQGVYNIDTFMERSNAIQSKIDEMEAILKKTQKEINGTDRKAVPFDTLEYFVDVYEAICDISEKNALLKKIIDRIEYRKEKNQRLDEFTLNVWLKI